MVKSKVVVDDRLQKDSGVVVVKYGFQLRVMRWFSVLERKDRVETGAMEDSLMDGA